MWNTCDTHMTHMWHACDTHTIQYNNHLVKRSLIETPLRERPYRSLAASEIKRGNFKIVQTMARACEYIFCHCLHRLLSWSAHAGSSLPWSVYTVYRLLLWSTLVVVCTGSCHGLHRLLLLSAQARAIVYSQAHAMVCTGSCHCFVASGCSVPLWLCRPAIGWSHCRSHELWWGGRGKGRLIYYQLG